jgi:hypothetical protein
MREEYMTKNTDLKQINIDAKSLLREEEYIIEKKYYQPYEDLPLLEFYLSNKGRYFQGGYNVVVPPMTDVEDFLVWAKREHKINEYTFRLKECSSPCQ